MKKTLKFYALGWALLLGLFNLIVFIVPAWPNLEKYTASFWIGYSLTTVAFLGQLACAVASFKASSLKKTFYNISLFSAGYAGLIATFCVALICMVITPMPYWISAIACAVVLIVNVIAVLKASIAVDFVASVDKKVEAATAFIYIMREESETLLMRAKTEEAKAVCKKVRDAFKYSDPMSNSGLAAVEAEIQNSFAQLQEAVADGKAETVISGSDELLALIAERNNKCKRLK